MARNLNATLAALAAQVDEVDRQTRALGQMHNRIDRLMAEARIKGGSLRAIAEIVGTSDVTVLNRTRDLMPTNQG